MTVICAQITHGSVIHATDSLLTKSLPDDTVIPIQKGHPKIIRIPHFKGAISYWGKVRQTAQDADGSKVIDWDALDWLLSEAKPETFDNAQSFADSLADTMSYRLADILMNVDRGIGLHFTAFEEVDGEQIPELFLITNYSGFTNTGGYPAGPRIISQRQTYFTLKNDFNFGSHQKPECRLEVQKVLRDFGGRFTYNNGHVLQFCQTEALIDSRGVPLSERPIRIVERMIQEQQAWPENLRKIAEPCFELAISASEPIYASTTHKVEQIPASE